MKKYEDLKTLFKAITINDEIVMTPEALKGVIEDIKMQVLFDNLFNIDELVDRDKHCQYAFSKVLIAFDSLVNELLGLSLEIAKSK